MTNTQEDGTTIKTISSPVLLSLRDLAGRWHKAHDKHARNCDLRLATSTEYQAGRREGLAAAYAECATQLLELSLGVEE